MIIKKITIGFVVQDFDTDKGEFVSQEFIAGDEVDVEDEHGNGVDDTVAIDAAYLPFDMVQPNNDEMPSFR